MYYLCINLGCYEGWSLEPYPTFAEAIEATKKGKCGLEWKILKEIKIIEDKGGDENGG